MKPQTDHSSTVPTITPELLKTMPLRDYSEDAGKAAYGKLLVVAGSVRLAGAAILTARAALRTGCGTVRVAAPQSVALHIGIAVPELMVIPLPETDAGTASAKSFGILEKQFDPCDALVVGPGLDEHPETDDLCRKLIAESPLPTVIDAQALLAYAQNSELGNGASKAPRVWTPHIEELQTLLGGGEGKKRAASEINEENREETAKAWVEREKSVLVFKGRETLIASPNGELYKNTAGTRGLGTAGSGDVLAGVIGSLLAQKLDAVHAAVNGVYVHALAGEAAESDLGDDGMMARDFLERLPQVLRYLRRHTPKKESKPTGLRPVG